MATVVGYRGCSGGGVFDKDGKYVGMFVAVAGNNLGYYIPKRKIEVWAKKNKVDFLFDPKAKVPDWEPLKR